MKITIETIYIVNAESDAPEVYRAHNKQTVNGKDDLQNIFDRHQEKMGAIERKLLQ